MFDGGQVAATPLQVTLRGYQQGAIDAIYAWFERESGNPLVVAPTGSGKSMIAAGFIHSVVSRWPTERIVVVTHVRELVAQDYDALLRAWPNAPAGICSAGLRRREWRAPILFAGIQTVYKHAAKVGWTDLVIIDEAHLLPKEGFGMYRTFLDALLSMNDKLKVIGLTATPFRTDSGRLDAGKDRMFHGIAYDCDLVKLIDDGFLSPVKSRGTKAEIDVSGVHKRGGEFIAGELEAAAMADGLVEAAADEIVARGIDRKSWLVFCCGIEHARQVREALATRGIESACVFGDTHLDERDATVQRFRAGALRAVVNVGVFTTGFDAPNVDMIVLLRATESPGLYVQMVGRGLRRAPGKTDCLVLDFGGNVERHGPLDAIKTGGGEKDDEEPGAPPVRKCPECLTFVLISLKVCPECGFEFEILAAESGTPPHQAKPDEESALLSRDQPAIERWQVVTMKTREHHKEGKPTSMRVDYDCGFRRWVSEWVCFEHAGFARKKAEQWWRERGGKEPIPETVDQARVRIEFGELRKVLSVTVDQRGEYPRLISVKLEETEAGVNEEFTRHGPGAGEEAPF